MDRAGDVIGEPGGMAHGFISCFAYQGKIDEKDKNPVEWSHHKVERLNYCKFWFRIVFSILFIIVKNVKNNTDI